MPIIRVNEDKVPIPSAPPAALVEPAAPSGSDLHRRSSVHAAADSDSVLVADTKTPMADSKTVGIDVGYGGRLSAVWSDVRCRYRTTSWFEIWTNLSSFAVISAAAASFVGDLMQRWLKSTRYYSYDEAYLHDYYEDSINRSKWIWNIPLGLLLLSIVAAVVSYFGLLLTIGWYVLQQCNGTCRPLMLCPAPQRTTQWRSICQVIADGLRWLAGWTSVLTVLIVGTSMILYLITDVIIIGLIGLGGLCIGAASAAVWLAVCILTIVCADHRRR